MIFTKWVAAFTLLHFVGSFASGQVIDDIGPANLDEFTHQVLISVRYNNPPANDAGPQWVGSGTLISDDWVLTCAHIFDYNPLYGSVTEVEVKYRAINVNEEEQSVAVEARVHFRDHRDRQRNIYAETYRPEEDIALLLLKNRINGFYNLAALPRADAEIANGATVRWAGYGKTRNGEGGDLLEGRTVKLPSKNCLQNIAPGRVLRFLLR